MNRMAQRRDITDEKVSAELASMVETVPNLERLYLLTFADTSAVGPGVWTVWKGTLLAELYRRTLEYLVRQRPLIALTDIELSQRLRPMILEALGSRGTAADVDAFLDVMPARYLMITPPGQSAIHIGLLHTAHHTPVALHAEQHLSAGFSSVTICTAARRGVFSLIAGALSRNKLNILSAQIYTSSTGFALDTLQVETLERKPVIDPQVWRHVEADLCAALQDERHVAGILTQRLSPRQERQLQVFATPPYVVINNHGSDSHTIIEVQAQDRLGLLYRLTRLLYDHGLDIALAKISTEGNRAIDVFYVTDAVGQKLATDTQIAAIRQALLETLGATAA
jgi:[protein-PII] uridylyltransferase